MMSTGTYVAHFEDKRGSHDCPIARRTGTCIAACLPPKVDVSIPFLLLKANRWNDQYLKDTRLPSPG